MLRNGEKLPLPRSFPSCRRAWPTLLDRQQNVTGNLSKAHVARDNSGPATLAISVSLQCKELMHLERILKTEASVRKTP